LRHSLLAAAFLIISYNLPAQKNIDLRSNLKYNTKCSAIWGYTAPDNKEYALVGLFTGVSIVDISNPDSVAELFNIPSIESNWRELKEWKGYAFVTNERDSGILIINLNMLPDSIATRYWKADSSSLETAHTVFIDENGIGYFNGFNNADDVRPPERRGILIADLNTDPWNPSVLGVYDDNYVHDCFVRGDTIWAAEIYKGWFSVINAASKANPVIINTHPTPYNFTHSTWLSENGQYLFITDEVSGASFTSYDVSDLDNIKELDRYRSSYSSGIIPHNVHVRNYKDGVTVVDVSRPQNMVETGRFDTSPFLSEDGFAGCWAVYPYFPSGTIIASDIEEGLFVLTPRYKRACYLEGNITLQSNGAPLQNVRVELIGNDWFEFSDIAGNYKTGIADSGSYDVRVFMSGCDTKIIQDVLLTPGNVTTLNITMNCPSLSVANLNYAENHFIAAPSIFNNYSVIKYTLLPTETATSAFIITDISGKVMQRNIPATATGEVIFGQTFQPGVYFITLQTEHYFQNLKVIKTY
jgi:choice-of-anchor B domain-containing protein